MHELSRRIDLVKEVRSTHILLESERADKEAEKMRVMGMILYYFSYILTHELIRSTTCGKECKN